jgi:hypothetical protein
MTLGGITAQEPQQSPVLGFSITLTQKRVRPPVWIILVLHAELASVRALPAKGLDDSNLPSTLELVLVPSLLHTQTKFRKCKYKFSRIHVDGKHTLTHSLSLSHTQSRLPYARCQSCPTLAALSSVRRSGPGEARTILLLHIFSARPSRRPLIVRTFLKVYMELGSYFVSARTNKRHHHHQR